MSRDLPANPNLEYLKKEAKELLRERRQHEPRATLAAVQHSLAREYGFKSWLVLKGHVETSPGTTMTAATPEAASQGPGNGGRGANGAGGQGSTPAGGPPANYSFDRYSPKAREALFFSRYEAAQVGSTEIEPAHLLLGLVRAGQSFRSRLFEGMPLEEAKATVMRATVAQPALTNSHVIPFAEATKRALVSAVGEADRCGQYGLGIVHLVLGLLQEEGSIAATVLTTAGIQAGALRQDIDRFVDEAPL